MKQNVLRVAKRSLAATIAKRWSMRTSMALLLLIVAIPATAAEKLNAVFILADNKNESRQVNGGETL